MCHDKQMFCSQYTNLFCCKRTKTIAAVASFCCDFLFCNVSDEYMPVGVFEMSRFSKVSSIFGRDAFATMCYVTLLNVSEIRDISNDEPKSLSKMMITLLAGLRVLRKACKSYIRDDKT